MRRVSIVADRAFLGRCTFGKGVSRPSDDWLEHTILIALVGCMSWLLSGWTRPMQKAAFAAMVVTFVFHLSGLVFRMYLQDRLFEAFGGNRSEFRQRDPLYWFDSEWLEAILGTGWEGNNLRFGPDADWRVKPILKSRHHN